MLVTDEVRARDTYMSLSFVEFLEALGRCADAASVPTDEALHALGVSSVLEVDGAIQVHL